MVRRWRLVGCLFLVALLGTARGGTAVQTTAPAVVPVETGYVALTFDDGPRRGTTDRLLDGLKERGASATFFLVGERIAANQDLVERMQAEGHQVGNHTWSHVQLRGNAAAGLAEVRRTDTLLREVLGEGTYWLRPPYGLIDAAVQARITVPMVKWSVDPEDWKKLNTAGVVRAVKSHVKPNSIILLHDIYPTSVDAALELVDALQAEGYCFVTVEELLALNGVQPQPGTLIRSGDAPA